MAAGHTGGHRRSVPLSCTPEVKGRGTFQEKSISQEPQSRWTPGWHCLSKLNEEKNGSQWKLHGEEYVPCLDQILSQEV